MRSVALTAARKAAALKCASLLRVKSKLDSATVITVPSFIEGTLICPTCKGNGFIYGHGKVEPCETCDCQGEVTQPDSEGAERASRFRTADSPGQEEGGA